MNPPSKIMLSTPELQSVGCINCVFRLNGQCFHGLALGESLAEGYCTELLDWLFSLGNTPSKIWENYHLFVSRLQSMEDYKNYKELELEISSIVNSHDPHLEKLEMKKTACKVWWSRLNEQVLKTLGKINDRESRTDNVDKMVGTISLNQIHKLANAAKELE